MTCDAVAWYCSLKPYVSDPIQSLETLVLVVATVALARATFGLFQSTVRVATETKDLAQAALAGNAQADAHHRQTLQPLIVALTTLTIEGGRADDGSGTWIFTLQGTVQNVGPGPALNVHLVVRPQGFADRSILIGPIAKGETRHLVRSNTWTYNRQLVAADLARRGQPYRAFITALDLFGSIWVTEESTPSGLPADLTWEFVTPNPPVQLGWARPA